MLDFDEISLKRVVKSFFKDNKFRDLNMLVSLHVGMNRAGRACEYFSVLNALTMNSEV
jgi:urea transporter